MAMSTLHLVDPELAPVVAVMPALVLNAQSLPALRAAMAARKQPITDDVPGVVVSERRAAAGSNDREGVRVLVYEPQGRSGREGALLWMHAGGYVVGSADADDQYCRRLASAAGCVVVSVDYRLAPEAPHPAPLDDCDAAYRWLLEQAATLRVNPDKLAIGGQSAGGGLAAALAQRLRDRGAAAPAIQLLFYPMLDDRTAAAQRDNRHTGEFVWTRDNNRFGWFALLGHPPGGEDVPSSAAPARASDFRGLAPAYIAVGALDLFVDEDLAYASRLLAAGVPVELHVYPGAYHGFDRLVADSRVATRAWSEAVNALRTAAG
jgi:triacylglycerol lipase